MRLNCIQLITASVSKAVSCVDQLLMLVISVLMINLSVIILVAGTVRKTATMVIVFQIAVGTLYKTKTDIPYLSSKVF